VPVALKQSETLNEIRLEGVIDISCAAELKAHLLLALKSGNAVRVSFETALDLDMTVFQLLWAAERESKKTGVEFAFAGLVPEQINNVLAQTGLDRFLPSVDAMTDSGVDKCQP
jgi:anti-anti-sigma regulatory factor